MKLRQRAAMKYVDDVENTEDGGEKNIRVKPTLIKSVDNDDDDDFDEEIKRINLKKKARKRYVDITKETEKLNNKRTRLPTNYVESEDDDIDMFEPAKKTVDISDDYCEDDEKSRQLPKHFVDLAENVEHRMSLRKQSKVMYCEFLDDDDSDEKQKITNKNDHIRLDIASSLSDDDVMLSDLQKNDDDDDLSLSDFKNKQNELVFLGEFCGKRKRGKYRDKLRYCPSMGEEILAEDMLSDMTINYSLLLLHKQFPSHKGLEDTELGPNNLFSVHPGIFVQILFADSHWLVVCGTDKTRCDELLVYDSSNRYGKLSFLFLKQMCQLRKPTKQKKLTITIQPVQQQQNGVDCGILALCYAVDLIHDIDPVNRHYHVPKLRQHLYACLTEGKFHPFPTTKKTLTRGNLCKQSRISVKINCTCRRMTSQGVILCSGCHQLYHRVCGDIPAKCFDDQTFASAWLCGTCDKDREMDLT